MVSDGQIENPDAVFDALCDLKKGGNNLFYIQIGPEVAFYRKLADSGFNTVLIEKPEDLVGLTLRNV